MSDLILPLIVIAVLAGMVALMVHEHRKAMEEAADLRLQDKPRQTPEVLRFSLWLDNQVSGPFAVAEIAAMKMRGHVTQATLVCREGDEEWLPLSTFEDLFTPRQPVKVAAVSSPPQEPANSSGEINLTKAGLAMLGVGLLLAILLGLGLIEMVVLAAGIVCLILGLCRS